MASQNTSMAGGVSKGPGQGDIRIFTPNGAGNKDLAECLKHAIQVRKDILRDSGLGQELKHVALVVDANNVLVPRWSGQALNYGAFSSDIRKKVEHIAAALTEALADTIRESAPDISEEKFNSLLQGINVDLVCVVDGPPGSATQDVSGPKGGPLLGKNPEKLPREPLEPTDRVHDHLPNFGVHQTLATLANIAKVSKKLDAVNVRCISSCLEGDRMAHACAVELGAVAAISTDRDYLGFNVPRIFWPGDVHLAYAVPGKLQFVQAAITLLGTDFHAKGKEVDIQGHGKKTAYFRKHGVFDMDNMYEDFVGCVGQVAGDLDKIWRGMNMKWKPEVVEVLELLTKSATRRFIQSNCIKGLQRKQQEWLDACTEVERWKQQAIAPMWIDGAFFDLFSTDVGVTFSREEEGPGGSKKKGVANQEGVLKMARKVYTKHLNLSGRKAMLQHVAKGIAKCTIHRASWEHLLLATGYVRQSIPMFDRTTKAEEEKAFQALWSSWQGLWAFMGHEKSEVMVDRPGRRGPSASSPCPPLPSPIARSRNPPTPTSDWVLPTRTTNCRVPPSGMTAFLTRCGPETQTGILE